MPSLRGFFRDVLRSRDKPTFVSVSHRSTVVLGCADD
jgi:hypothetical protein